MRRVLAWLRTTVKLVLLVLCYIWSGTIYKFVYAQAHDVRRFENRLPVPYYQQQFLVDSLLQQTWILGPDFRQFIGELPSLGALMNRNLQSTLAEYCERRERELLTLPDRFPYSLVAEQALEDAYVYAQGVAMFSVSGARERPAQVLATYQPGLGWRMAGLPDAVRAARVARRLADLYPDNAHAPLALLREGEAAIQAGRQEDGREIYRRVVHEYPKSAEAEQAADVLVRASREGGDLESARHYRRLGLEAATYSTRETHPGTPPPPRAVLMIAGLRLDLAGLELQFREWSRAQELTRLAAEEVTRLAGQRLDDSGRRDLRDRGARLDQVRNQIWVADLFRSLGFEAPGPPPQADSFEVTGRVLLEGRPLPGVEIYLGDRSQGPRPGPRALARAARSRLFRGVTDASGRYRVAGVTPGRYVPTLVFPSMHRPRGGPAFPIVPVSGGTVNGFPAAVDLGPSDRVLPDLTFRRALGTRTFGEIGLEGDRVRLQWDPWPGATRYRLEVLAAPGLSRIFDRRIPARRRSRWRAHPVLWEGEAATGTAAVPAADLMANDGRTLLAAQYEYVVRAFDGAGREIAASCPPLGRFYLSAGARLRMIELTGGRASRRDRRERDG